MAIFETKEITAENQFTDSVTLSRDGGYVVIEDTGSMAMTVSLQCQPEGASTWIPTGDTWTEAGSHVLLRQPDIPHRLGVATGAFTSGTATVWLYRIH